MLAGPHVTTDISGKGTPDKDHLGSVLQNIPPGKVLIRPSSPSQPPRTFKKSNREIHLSQITFQNVISTGIQETATIFLNEITDREQLPGRSIVIGEPN
jgi:hypothetical protein